MSGRPLTELYEDAHCGRQLLWPESTPPTTVATTPSAEAGGTRWRYWPCLGCGSRRKGMVRSGGISIPRLSPLSNPPSCPASLTPSVYPFSSLSSRERFYGTGSSFRGNPACLSVGLPACLRLMSHCLLHTTTTVTTTLTTSTTMNVAAKANHKRQRRQW